MLPTMKENAMIEEDKQSIRSKTSMGIQSNRSKYSEKSIEKINSLEK